MSVSIPENETTAPKTVAELTTNPPNFPEFDPDSEFGVPQGQTVADRNTYIRDLTYAAEQEGWNPLIGRNELNPLGYMGVDLSYSSAGAQPIATKPNPNNPGTFYILYSDGTEREDSYDNTAVNRAARGGFGAAGSFGGVGGFGGGAGSAFTGPGGTNAMGFTSEQMGAREFLLATMRQYFGSASDAKFVSDLSNIIDGYIRQGYSADTISVLLPQTDPYKQRFKGNEGRIAAGLSALSPGEYLQTENAYNEILSRFNLGDLSTRETFSSLIGGQVSAAELTDRVVNVYDRIRNADPALRAELDRVEALGGNITDADFAKALLTGQTGANELKRKISTAEISAEARTRNLSVARAQELQQLGITREEARAGFETIAQAQPTFEKLAGIYDRETLAPATSQTELEREVFQGMQSQRRKRLVQQEQAAFSGASGLAGSALSTQRAGQL